MVYIKINDNHIDIPKHTAAMYDDYDLYVINTLTQKVVIYRDVIDNQSSDFEYSFDINTTILDDNTEYQYNLMKKKILVETGMLRVGDFEQPETTEYVSENNDIIAYGG